ncbi:MAG: YncE family protein [candidate division WOR-3 bacterium]|nr:YncE family protein [candidate division WOR-3 bacterium]
MAYGRAVRPLLLCALALGLGATIGQGQWLETTVSLPDSSGPYALCYNSQDNKVYSANRCSNTVAVIDGATNLVVATVPVDYCPQVLCYNPLNNKVYSANVGDMYSTETVIDGTTDSVIATIAGGEYPSALCYNLQAVDQQRDHLERHRPGHAITQWTRAVRRCR